VGGGRVHSEGVWTFGKGGNYLVATGIRDLDSSARRLVTILATPHIHMIKIYTPKMKLSPAHELFFWPYE